ncbi:MAG: type I methionyl aminopeptidase [Legionellales bacterium]|nr:type I methionyl aminopeptidase [Legionellales bacterium]|tara:strand:+ start:295 stop:1065 length:771 start_codon:yes stop_codon:yes gene_type:complete
MAARINTPEDIAKMRVAAQAAASVLVMIGEHVQPGITTAELDDICLDYMRNTLGAEPAPPTVGFPKATCISVNHVVCHGIPSEKKLKKGDALNIDVSLIKDGYFGDTSKMYFAGEPTVLGKRLATVTQECLYKAIKIVKPGATLGDIGATIQQHAEANRYTVVREFCGHGINKVFHDEPQVLHYGEFGKGAVLEPGMIFTIEPMINAGKRHIKMLPDGWTAVTKDHKLTAQWEHTILVTETGYEVLTLREEEQGLL